VSLESVLNTTRRAPTSLESNNPHRIASYSIWLFEALKLKCRDFSMRIWLDPSNIISGLAPLG